MLKNDLRNGWKYDCEDDFTIFLHKKERRTWLIIAILLFAIPSLGFSFILLPAWLFNKRTLHKEIAK